MEKARITGRILRYMRIVLSLLTGGVITASAAGMASFLPAFAQWIEKVQIFPAVMSFSMAVFVSWLIVTLIFGRIYCSTFCPLGLLQDICARLPRLTRAARRRHPYQYRRPIWRLQYAFLVVVLVAMMAGLSYVASIFDPYTVYVGIVKQTALPAVRCVESAGATIGNATGWWSMSMPERILSASVSGCVVNTVMLILVGVTSMFTGRTICNTLCPVGTTLGFISRYAVMQIDIDTDKCIHCGACAAACKASCIDLSQCTVDGARCVDCFDCLPVCPNDAIHYTGRRHQLADVMMQRIGGQRRRTETAAPTAMQADNTVDSGADA